MSTKTSIKRIALVAVSALGFGLLSVVPAKATAGDAATNASISSLTITNPTSPSAGASAAFTVAVTNRTQIAAGTADTYAIRARITSAPAGGLSAFTGAFVAVTGWTNGTGAVGNSGANLLSATWSTGNLAANTTTSIGTLTFTPAVAGTYLVNFYHDANTDGIQQDNEVYQTASITVAATSIANEIPNSADTTAGADSSLNGVKVSSVGIETVQVSGRTGIQVGFVPQYRLTRNAGTITANNGTGSMTGKVATISYSVTNPAGTAVTVVSAQGGTTSSSSQAIAGLADPLLASATADVARTQAISPTTGWPQKGSIVYFSAATAGTYTITAFHDANRDGLVSVGEATTSSNVVVAADAIPTITFTTYGQTVPADAAAGGAPSLLVKVSLRNGTAPVSLGASEVLTITGPTGTIIDKKSQRNANFKLALDQDAGDGVSTTLTQANFDGQGNAYLELGHGTAGTYTLTASIAGGTAAGASGSHSFTVLDTSAAPTGRPVTRTTDNTDKVTSFRNLTGVAYAAGNVARAVSDGDVTKALNIAPNKAITVSVGYLVGAANTTATDKTYEAVATDTYGLITGLIGGVYPLKTQLGDTATTATTAVSFSLPIPAIPSTISGVLAQIAVLQDDAGTASTSTFTIAQAASAPTTVLVDPSSATASTYAIRAAAGSTNTFGATVVDQYGIAMATQAVTAQVTAGRNAQTIATPLVTDATGKVSYAVADVFTGTTLLTDTLTFTTTVGAKVGTVTINYAATLPVATVEVTGGASEDVAPARTTNAINAGTSGASGTRVTMTATLKDANGATLPAGIPVTWAISGLDNKSAIWTDTTTGYNWATSLTNSDGKAVTYVYAWGTGAVTVTATAGAVKGTGSINFVNAAADARVVSATVNGNVITAKVVDRYGNAVEGVNLSAVRDSGVGYFAGSASSGATGVTGANGTVDFIVTGGAAKITVKTTTLNFGQTSSAAGQVNGTAITATSIGASLSPAGVQSVTVDVTANDPATDAAASAADAAAEAIDAANAATDAANLAAEAADAATVAAEEARDAADAATAAVEELATQVATLMAALKAQITTLANTVAKIAKRVRA